MRVLVVTKIFPNSREPLSAPFNRQQFAALGRRCDVEVLATIPWFPGAGLAARWSAAGRLTGVPARERIAGLDVAHPRFLYVPRLPSLGGGLYAASLLPEALRRRGRADVLLGSWAWPDGGAAVLLGRALGVPAVVKLHGSDMNVVARMPGPRRAMRALLPRAARVVAVSRALADAAADLGVARERIDVVPNGVDETLFNVRPRAPARAALGLRADARWLLYVGRLEEAKGVLDLAAAFATLTTRRPDVGLVLVGEGSARARLAAALAMFGERVVLAGAQPLERVPEYLAACDALVLPSWNEGTPNVLLEALACGRKVVATRVGGCPDVVDSPHLGVLVPPRAPDALAAALAEAVSWRYEPAEVAAAGARGGWDDSAARLHESLRRAAGSPS